MPLHDWTRVWANRFHDFHQKWANTICNALNLGQLPSGYFAMLDQIPGGPTPDVVALELTKPNQPTPGTGVTLAEHPPRARFVTRTTLAADYARRANRVAIYHPDGDVVAMLEIVSPGNKDSKHAIMSFTRKAVKLLQANIHLLIVDVFPPNRRNPQGIHKAIWDYLTDEPFTLPPDKPLTTVAYAAGSEIGAWVEPMAVGDPLPDMPIFLTAESYVLCPLEATYQAAWETFPALLREPLIAP